VGESESKKWKEHLTTIAADDELRRKSRERKKKKKNKERDFRSGSWDPGGGGGGGGDALRARAPRGQVPSALPPFPFSPSLPPEGGSPPLLKFSFVRKHKMLHLLKPDTLMDVEHPMHSPFANSLQRIGKHTAFACGECIGEG